MTDVTHEAQKIEVDLSMVRQEKLGTSSEVKVHDGKAPKSLRIVWELRPDDVAPAGQLK